jgi:hypothetical protein
VIAPSRAAARDESRGRSGLAWTGAGEIAFVGSLGAVEREEGPGDVPRGPEGPIRAAPPGGIDDALRSGAGADAAAAVDGFLAGGGKECLVAHASWAEGLRSGRGRAEVDAASAAVAALAERDDAGTIVLLGESARSARDLALDLASRREDVFILMEGRGGDPRAAEAAAAERGPGSPSLSLARENAAVARFPPGFRDGPREMGLLAAYLVTSDFSEEEPFLPGWRARPARGGGASPGGAAPAWIGERERAALELWRRGEGLRRSIDRGTRWVLFEASRPFLRRRVEREVTGFLRRLADLGLLERGAGFTVECSRAGAPGESGRIEVRVEALLAPVPARVRAGR